MCESSTLLTSNIVNNYSKYLNRKVSLVTAKCEHRGHLKCIDPLTASVAVVTRNDNTSSVIIAMSHSIKSITLIDDHINDDTDDNINIEQFLSTDMGHKSALSAEEVRVSAERKRRVIEWFAANHVPVEELEDGSLVVAYALTLSSPYGSRDCICPNEIVLGKIQNLLDSMPESMSESMTVHNEADKS